MSTAFEGSKNIFIWFFQLKKKLLPRSKHAEKQKTKAGWWQQIWPTATATVTPPPRKMKVTNTLPALFTLCWGSFIFPSLQQKKILSLHGQLDSASTEEKQSQKQQLFQWTAVLYSEGLRSSYAGKHFLQGEKKFRVTINIAQLIIIIIGSSLNQRKEDRTPTATYIQRNEHRKIKGKIVLHEAWAHCSDKAWTTMDVCQLTSELVNTILKRQRKRILYYAGYTNHKYLVLRFSASPSQG